MRACLLPCLLAFALAGCTTVPPDAVPRTSDGNVNLSAPSPRFNGKPDLTGVWQAERTPLSEYPPPVQETMTRLQVDYNDVTKEYLSIFWPLPPDQEPLHPAGAALLKQHQERGEDAPAASCLPTSLPGSLVVLLFKIIQAPRETVMLFDNGDPARQIFTDGRPMPGDAFPSWMGYSIGRWDGDVFVIDTAGFNDRGQLDGSGHPRSEAMKMTERYRRPDYGHMQVDITLNDSNYYTRPVDLHLNFNLQPDTDVFEYVCNENEKDRSHTSQ